MLVGTTASGLRDVRATPLDPVAAGVSVHAQIIEQILLGEYLERPDWATGAELLYLLALGVLLALAIPRVGAVGTALLGAGGIAVAIALSWYAYTSWRGCSTRSTRASQRSSSTWWVRCRTICTASPSGGGCAALSVAISRRRSSMSWRPIPTSSAWAARCAT